MLSTHTSKLFYVSDEKMKTNPYRIIKKIASKMKPDSSKENPPFPSLRRARR